MAATIPWPGFMHLPKSSQNEEHRYIDVPSESLHAAEMMIANGVGKERLVDLLNAEEDMQMRRRLIEEMIDEMQVTARRLHNERNYQGSRGMMAAQVPLKDDLKRLNKTLGDSISIRHYLKWRLDTLSSLHPELSPTVCPTLKDEEARKAYWVANGLPTFDLTL
jgi:hypothetical protein